MILGRDRVAEAAYCATPMSPFLGPPLPEGLQVYWPDFMLASRPGVVAMINKTMVNTKNRAANAISGREKYPVRS